MSGVVSVLNRGSIAWELAQWLRTLPREVRVIGPRGNQIPKQRNLSAEMDSDWVLYVDSDCVPPPFAFEQILHWEVDLVGGVVCERFPPFAAVVLKTPESRWRLHDMPRQGLEPVAACGTGFLLVRRPVFQAMDAPWFRCGQIIADLLLEDVEFCFRAKAAGVQPFVDCGLRIGHLGGGIIWPGRDGRPWMQWHGGKSERTEPCEDIPSDALGVEAWR